MTTKRRAIPTPVTLGAGGGSTRVAFYLRISTDEEHQPFSLGAQETRLAAFVASQASWEQVRTYTDQFSGAYAERPALADALRDARLGRYDILLVNLVDRFARSLKVLVGLLEELENVGVAFRSATEPIDTSTATGRMLVQLLGVFAEFERATIIDRVVAGMERKASRGGWPGGRVPYGLCLDENKHLAVEPAEFPVVERIFTRYGRDRLGAATIAAELNADQLRTRRGRRFSPQVVLGILRNRGYLGEVSFRDVTHLADEPILDPVLFEKAQALLTERGEAYAQRMRDAHPEYLLTGLITCGDCGRNYVGVSAAGRGHRYHYYACWGRQRYGKETCTGGRNRADVLEAVVFDAILALYADPDLIERAVATEAQEAVDTERQRRDEIVATTSELKKAEDAIERYVRAFEAGTVSDEIFGPRVRELGDRARTLRARRDGFTEAAEAAEVHPPTQADLDILHAELGELLRYGSEARRKAVDQAFVQRLVVEGPGVVRPTFLVRGGLPASITEQNGQTAPDGAFHAVTDLAVLPCHSTRPPSTADGGALAQVDGPLLCLPALGTVLRQIPGEPPVHPTDPLVGSLPVQRRLGPGEVADLVAAYRRGVLVEELAASFRVNRTTVLGHVRRHGVPKRDRRALQGDVVDRAVQLYAGGQSADSVAAQLGVAASTVRRAMKEADITMRPGGRQRRDDSTLSSPLNITEHGLELDLATGQRAPISFPGRRR